MKRESEGEGEDLGVGVVKVVVVRLVGGGGGVGWLFRRWRRDRRMVVIGVWVGKVEEGE